MKRRDKRLKFRLEILPSIDVTKSPVGLSNFCRPGPLTSPSDRQMNKIIEFLLFLLIFAALPFWPYSESWGYQTSTGLAIVLTIFLLLRMFRAI